MYEVKPLSFPRIVIAGTQGDSGKTLISLSIARALKDKGYEVCAFKKGPDYIDAGWLMWVTGRPARNLDTYLFGEKKVYSNFTRWGCSSGINIIEGNRGMFDGMDAQGTHSTYTLAKTLKAPVILIIPCTKMTATVSAIVEGFRALAEGVEISGIILNRVNGKRHETILREAIGLRSGINVLGAIPYVRGEEIIPERHLGLVQASEFGNQRLEELLDRIASYIDIKRLIEIAMKSPLLVPSPFSTTEKVNKDIKIGVFRDSAFSFYYPENLESLEDAGAELIFISPLADEKIPEIDGLYIGGGFPENFAKRLYQNKAIRERVRQLAIRGLPIYAECGGLMYLSESIYWKGESFEMCGVLPFRTFVHDTPQGHGYAEALVEHENPIFPVGMLIKGHEFHYSSIKTEEKTIKWIFTLKKGNGADNGKCGIQIGNTIATYIHIHASGCPKWADGFVSMVRNNKALGQS